MVNPWRSAAIALAALLCIVIAGAALFHPHVVRPLVAPGNEALVAAAERDMATLVRRPVEDVRQTTFPIFIDLSDRRCVALRAKAQVGSDYVACQDRHGKFVEKRLSGHGSSL